jgi:hypothetical protein
MTRRPPLRRDFSKCLAFYAVKVRLVFWVITALTQLRDAGVQILQRTLSQSLHNLQS